MEATNTFSPESLATTLKADKNNNGAEFTIVSKVTGKDYTYKISRSEWKGKFYTHIRVEQGYLNFNYLGSYFNGKMFKKRILVNTPSAIAISWVLDKVEKGMFDLLNKSVELKHLGCCVRCGRTLTDNNSIEAGLGPVCRNL